MSRGSPTVDASAAAASALPSRSSGACALLERAAAWRPEQLEACQAGVRALPPPGGGGASDSHTDCAEVAHAATSLTTTTTGGPEREGGSEHSLMEKLSLIHI